MSASKSAYLTALSEHIDQCEYDLKSLREMLSKGKFSRLKQHTTKRTLQMLIESAIGLAKH
ncbi:hypothetical protein [Zhongshania sp. BJYM1]|uniref:hypothetical protein n=1 Tax=Zhongshania aquatica TaxID=2965069 RepID=UPI0022B55FF6|nr:hypothetical protein [Marortus sp. BJYM1]